MEVPKSTEEESLAISLEEALSDLGTLLAQSEPTLLAPATTCSASIQTASAFSQ